MCKKDETTKMNKEEIINNNIKIALFMGFKPYNVVNDEYCNVKIALFMGFKPYNVVNDEYCKMILEGVCIKISYFKFHNSWDFLMPVISKCHLYESKDDDGDFLFDDIIEALTNIDLDNTYLAVIKFIEAKPTKIKKELNNEKTI